MSMISTQKIKKDVKAVQSKPYILTVSSLRKGKYHVVTKPYKTLEAANKVKNSALRHKVVMAAYVGKIELGEGAKRVR